MWAADKVLIEDAGSGKSLCQEFRVQGTLRPLLLLPRGSKEERFTGCLGEVESGGFLLPREAPWLDAFKAELKAFPMGRHDDQVDSFSQFVRHQLRKWKWVITKYDQRGRGDRSTRMRNRPW